MKVTTAVGVSSELGKLSQIVIRYGDMVTNIVANGMANGFGPNDWSLLGELVATDVFTRVGCYRETMNWRDYTAMLTRWGGKARYEYTLRRMTEVGRLVFYDIEERHSKEDKLLIKNTVSVFEFDETDRICRLDVFEQCDDAGWWVEK